MNFVGCFLIIFIKERKICSIYSPNFVKTQWQWGDCTWFTGRIINIKKKAKGKRMDVKSKKFSLMESMIT